MKYLFLYKYNNIHGGIQSIIRNLNIFLKDNGNRIYILSDHPDYKKQDKMIENNLEIFYWNNKNVLKFLFEKEIDLICSFESDKKYLFLTLLFKIFKKKISSVLIFCGSHSERPSRFFKFFSKTGLIFKIYDKFIAISNYTANVAFKGNFIKKIKVIYPPIEIEKYKKTDFKRFNLITIGRICERKNFEDLIEIFDNLHKKQQNLFLDIIGGLDKTNVNYFNYLKNIIKKKKLEKFVNFHINIIEKEKIDLLSHSTLYISTSKHEMFGIATAEALSSWLPVIAYKNTATAEVCSLSGQILIEDRNKGKMVEKILSLLQDKKKLQKFSNIGREKAELLFSSENWSDYKKLFEDLTKEKQKKINKFKFLNFDQKIRKYLNIEGGYIWKKFEHRGVERILDIGCGEGIFLGINPNKIIGVDKNAEKVSLCKERGFQAIAVDIENEILPFVDDYFDGIVMMRLLEHLYSPIEVFFEVNRVLKLNSLFFIIVPTKNHKNYWRDYTHVRPYTIESLQMLADDTGFEIDEYFYTGNGIPFFEKLGLKKYINSSKIREKFKLYHTKGNIWAILRKSKNMRF